MNDVIIYILIIGGMIGMLSCGFLFGWIYALQKHAYECNVCKYRDTQHELYI